MISMDMKQNASYKPVHYIYNGNIVATEHDIKCKIINACRNNIATCTTKSVNDYIISVVLFVVIAMITDQ